MVIHPLALSEIPRHVRGGRSGHTAFSPSSRRSLGSGGALGCFEVRGCFQSLCLPGWTVLYQKHSKDTEETSVLLSIIYP